MIYEPTFLKILFAKLGVLNQKLRLSKFKFLNAIDFNSSYFLSAVEAVHLANLLCQFGYYFPINELKNLLVKDDSSLYRFQVPT